MEISKIIQNPNDKTFKEYNDYLLGNNKNSAKKENIEEEIKNFLEGRGEEFKTTILLTRVRGIGLTGYKEGYFNEIIQNANDLNYHNDNNEIHFECKKNGCEYTLSATYNDRGFIISNIYSFLTKDSSDKKGKQTGRFGVGIKSLFLCIDSLEIESNIRMKFTIKEKKKRKELTKGTRKWYLKKGTGKWRLKKEFMVEKEISINNENNKEKTRLEIKFRFEKNKEYNLNLKKLAELIDYLTTDDMEIDINKIFNNGKKNEILFDIKSLMFMKNEYPIKNIIFEGTGEKFKKEIKLSRQKIEEYNDIVKKIEECKDPKKSNKNYTLRKEKLCIKERKTKKVLQNEDEKEYLSLNEEEYLLFSNKDNEFINAIAFPINENEVRTKYYSTYLVAEEEKNKYCFSVFVDVKNTNANRNNIGEEQDDTNEVVEEIRKEIKSIIEIMLSDELNKKIKDKREILKDISIIFHRIFATEINIYKREMYNSNLENIIKNSLIYNCIGLSNKNLPVLKNEDIEYNKNKNFIYAKEVKIGKDILCQYFGKEEDNGQKEQIFYLEEINNGKEFIDYNVKEAYLQLNDIYEKLKGIYENYIDGFSEILNYFKDEAEYVRDVINGDRNKKYIEICSIDEYIYEKIKVMKTEEEKKKIFQNICKVIGDLEITEVIDKGGVINKSKISFKDYLFSENINDEKNYSIQNYYNGKEMYEDLKNNLLDNKLFFEYVDVCKKEDYEIIFLKPNSVSRRGWKGEYDLIVKDLKFNNSNNISEENKTNFLEIILNDKEIAECISDYGNRFILSGKRNKFKHDSIYTWNKYPIEYYLKKNDANKENLKNLIDKNILYNERRFMYFETCKWQLIDISELLNISLSDEELMKKTIKLMYEYINYKNNNKNNYEGTIIESIIKKIENQKIKCKFENFEINKFNESIFTQLLKYDENKELEEIIKYFNIIITELTGEEIEVLGNEKRDFLKKILGKEIYAYNFNGNSKKNQIVYMSKDNIKIRSGDEKNNFEKVGEFKGEGDKIFIFFKTKDNNVNSVIKKVMQDIGGINNNLEWIDSFVDNVNGESSISSGEYEQHIEKMGKLSKYKNSEWKKNENIKIISKIKGINLYKSIQTILESRGNYNNHCPLCGKVIKNSKNNKINKDKLKLITIIDSDNKETPYIITICCEECINFIKNIFRKSWLEENLLKINLEVNSGQDISKDYNLDFELSPINIKIIKEFNDYFIKNIY